MRVLIVDDSQELREMLADALAVFGWEILQAEDGQDAFQMLVEQKDQIDAILLDQIMPIMDGLNFLPKVLEIDPDMPVIMMTSYGSIPLAVEFMKNGGSGFIEKPVVNFEVLDLRLKEAMKHFREKKELEEIRASQQVMEMLTVAKDAFLSNVGHELRTPLTSILSFAALAKRRLEEGKTAEAMFMLDRLLVGKDRLLRFITSIESLAQIYTGKMAIYPKTENLVQLVEDVLLGMRDGFSQKNLQLSFCCSEILLVSFNALSIRIALYELISNAVKFSLEGGAIEVAITDSREQVQVSIIDSGPGIPSGEDETIMHPFSESSYTRCDSGGTGLGLSVARGIAQLHGGAVSVVNRQDSQGAVATLTFPKTRSEKSE